MIQNPLSTTKCVKDGYISAWILVHIMAFRADKGWSGLAGSEMGMVRNSAISVHPSQNWLTKLSFDASLGHTWEINLAEPLVYRWHTTLYDFWIRDTKMPQIAQNWAHSEDWPSTSEPLSQTSGSMSMFYPVICFTNNTRNNLWCATFKSRRKSLPRRNFGEKC